MLECPRCGITGRIRLVSVNRPKRIAEDIVGNRSSGRLPVITSRAEVNARKNSRLRDFFQCLGKTGERAHHPEHYIRFQAECCLLAKVVRQHCPAAPLMLECPDGYSGCAGVANSGAQHASGIVAALPSVSASGIAVIGRQKT